MILILTQGCLTINQNRTVKRKGTQPPLSYYCNSSDLL